MIPGKQRENEMHQATKSLREVAYPKPLRECGVEELAVHQITASPSGGILFARKTEHVEKDKARSLVLDLFGPDRYPNPISLLTMPGLFWTFEGALLNRRRMSGAKGTYFHCIESDRSIYHAAMVRMPGIRRKGSLTRVESGREFAERTVSCQSIRAFWFGDVDDLMASGEEQFVGAWLDYTGPLSIKRLAIIANFFANNIRDTLVITSLKARWNRPTSDAITKAGCLSTWIQKNVLGVVVHDIEYQDGASPMAQIAMSKTGTAATIGKAS